MCVGGWSVARVHGWMGQGAMGGCCGVGGGGGEWWAAFGRTVNVGKAKVLMGIRPFQQFARARGTGRSSLSQEARWTVVANSWRVSTLRVPALRVPFQLRCEARRGRTRARQFHRRFPSRRSSARPPRSSRRRFRRVLHRGIVPARICCGEALRPFFGSSTSV